MKTENTGNYALHLKTCVLRYYKINDIDGSEELLSGPINGQANPR